MNVKEYIKSGVIESYVLGMASEAEQQEFEQMCAAHPEVAEARDTFERSLEEKLLQEAQEPPAFLKGKIQEQIKPVTADSTSATEETIATPVKRMNVWKGLAAACFILLLGVGYWAYVTNEKYQELSDKQTAMEEQLQESVAQTDSLKQDAEILRHPMKTVALKGTDKAPKAQTLIFWDTTSTKNVYLLINNLPEPPSDKEYQLWAIIDKQPVDLGFFAYEVHQKRLLIKMKNVQKAQAFVITLEPRKKPDPSKPMGPAYVVGNL